MRALIVDDSRFVRGYVRGLLEEKGIDCEEAGDGQAALDLVLGGKPFDLALVDWNMPVMNGLDMLTARLFGDQGHDGYHRSRERFHHSRPRRRR
jgi:two-component system chemotaxis response regulator CheY